MAGMQPMLAAAPNGQQAAPLSHDPADQHLHDELLAHVHPAQSNVVMTMEGGHPATTATHHANIDPALGPSMMSATGPVENAVEDSGANSPSDNGTPTTTKGGKTRELSQTKRAAQNRAAQRAFRQRKDNYIKKLEEERTAHDELKVAFSKVQEENYRLRDYIISLQSKLIELHNEYPAPPPDLDISQQRIDPALQQTTTEHGEDQQQVEGPQAVQVSMAPQAPMPPPAPMMAPRAPMMPTSEAQLQASAAQAQAVADHFANKRRHEENRARLDANGINGQDDVPGAKRVKTGMGGIILTEPPQQGGAHAVAGGMMMPRTRNHHQVG